MPLETPTKCENCGNEELVHGLKLGRLNNLLSMGGPGQEPPPMGTQWAVYWCIQCDAIFPYKKHYAAQPQMQAQYERFYKSCKARMEQKKKLEETQRNLESVRSAQKTLAALPGGPGSTEAQSSSLVAPLLERLEKMEAEMLRRRGGRPRKKGKKPSQESKS